MQLNLIVAGVGGQGSVLASHIIAEAAIDKGFKVRVGETFGAAMRGGAVASHVRIGEVSSPLIQRHKAQAILALEPLEGLRVGLKFLAPTGIVILNTRPIPPVDVFMGKFVYPELEELVRILKNLGKEVYAFDATQLAIEAGNPRTLNSVILGALSASKVWPFPPEVLEEAIVARVPPQTREVNLRAFQLGKKKMESLDGE
jgi:Pyruvate:ferredoxin oxidoreductase and related 2-oxoacid:ferredoxin oxidoreductases, gamma subunit